MKISAFIPLFIVILVGVIFLIINLATHEEATPGAPPREHKVSVGKDYYVIVTQIELAPLNREGKPWDVNKSAPDMYHHIIWQDNTVFRSATEKDALIASWSALGVDLKEAILTGRVSLDSVVKAAVLHVYPGTEFSVRVYDKDVVDHDEAGVQTFTLENLHEGDNPFFGDEGDTIRRMNIRVVDKSKPIEKIIAQLTRP